jgi:CRISPR/Cas system-associated exonuclease Cas4 (RecB family)
LIGEIDSVVTGADGQPVLVDWKTSGRRWPKDQADKSLQPTAYLYAYGQLHPGCTDRFRFDVAVKNKAPVIELNTTTRTPDDFLRLERLVEKAEQVVAHELFYPSDQSFACAGCQYAEPCKAWHRQAARTTVTMAA